MRAGQQPFLAIADDVATVVVAPVGSAFTDGKAALVRIAEALACQAAKELWAETKRSAPGAAPAGRASS